MDTIPFCPCYIYNGEAAQKFFHTDSDIFYITLFVSIGLLVVIRKKSMEENLLVLAKGSGEEQKVAWEGLGEEMKRMIDIAGPMVVVTASQRLLQVVSVMMVGHLNDDLFLSSAALAISLTAVTGFSFLVSYILNLMLFYSNAKFVFSCKINKV